MITCEISYALMMLAKTEMVPFTETDFLAFSGVESENPLIGEYKGCTLIMDGRKLSVIDDSGETQFELVKL